MKPRSARRSLRRLLAIGLFGALSTTFVEAARAQSSGESAEAREVLDRAVQFMGGADAVYRMRTLVVTSEIRRDTGNGPATFPTRTSYAFPLSVRHEITINGRTLAIASSPTAGGTLFTEDGATPLAEGVRVGIERTTMRNPVVLMKSRLGRGFRADHIGRETLDDGRQVDLIRIAQHDNETIVAIERASGQPIEIRYRIDSHEQPARAMRVRFTDWRTAKSGLVYPHRSLGREGDQTGFETTTRQVEIDLPLPEAMFSAGLGADRSGRLFGK